MKEILKKLRNENRYSQEMLAKILGISRQAYMKYESGEVEPTVEIVRKLSKIYKVSYEVLINNELYSSKPKDIYLASASPVYGINNQNNNVNQFINSFGETINYLQNIITMMQKKLEAFQAMQPAETKVMAKSYSKSRSFNKNSFFNAVGKVNIDSSYVGELREESLI